MKLAMLQLEAFERIIEAWRGEAEQLRRRGIGSVAQTVESLADDLEATIRDAGSEAVNLQEASRLSGFSADHLGRLVKDGTIPNAGRKNAPRIQVVHLPRRPGCGVGQPGVSVIELDTGRRADGLEADREGRRVRSHSGGLAS